MKKHCYSPSDIPKKEHWAILDFVTVHIPGDERSRTNPGHGYPASERHACQSDRFVALKVSDVASFKTTVELAFPSIVKNLASTL